MFLKKTLIAAAAAASVALPAIAGEGLTIDDPYARAASPTAKAGAAFMTILNPTDTDDRLIAASTDVAMRVELHTHIEDADGVMRMVEVEDGFAVPAGGKAELKRGGLHVMMMGLTQPLEHGSSIDLLLVFEKAGEMSLVVPVDNERQDMMGHGGSHGS